MYSLACRDMGRDMGIDCDFVAKGETVDEAIAKMSEHAMQIHADKIKEMMKTMTEEQMKEAMKAKVKKI